MEAVFIRLLNMSLTASVLAVVVMVLRLGLKNAPKWVHCLMWAMVALRLILPFSFESPTSLLRDTQVITSDTFITVDSTTNADSPPVSEQPHIQIPQNSVQPIPSPAPAESGIELTTVLTIVWLVGMVVMAAYSLISYWRLRRQIAPSLALTRDIYLCDYIETPFILGIVRPRIYLPTAMDPSFAAHVLAHERAHIRRLDHWWKPLGFVLLTVHWFNPVIWLAYILLCRDIELACDEKVIKEMGCEDKRAYSEALLRCSVPRRMIAACPLAFGEVGVKERVKNVMSFKKPAVWIILAAVVICVVVAVCFLTDPQKGTPLADFQHYDSENIRFVRLTARFAGEKFDSREDIDRVVEFLEDARYDPNPTSQNRSEDRAKIYDIELNYGALSMHFYFDIYFTEMWMDDGVKPSLSYRMKDPDAVEEFFSTMLDRQFPPVENAEPTEPIEGTINGSPWFTAKVTAVEDSHIYASSFKSFTHKASISTSSYISTTVRISLSGIRETELLPGDVIRITYQGEIDGSKPYPDVNATNIEVVTPILPGSMRLRIGQALGTVDVTYFDALRTSDATVVAGVQYGNQYALAYFHETNDGPVFDRVVTMDELEPTSVDGVFHDPSADSESSCTYLITKPFLYAMVPRDFEYGKAEMRAATNAPSIRVWNTTQGSTISSYTSGRWIIYDIFPNVVEYEQKWSGMELALPEDWEYEILESETENGSYAIAFRPAGVEGWVVVQYSPDGFNPSETAVKTEDFILDHYKYAATMGYCDDSDVWSYIQFGAPYDNYAVVNEGADWLAIYYGDIVMRILRTLTLK